MTTIIIVMVALVIMSAYFSATETAFSTINKTKLKAQAEKGNKRAKLVLSMSEKYDRLISTILVGNNIVNIALSSLGTVLFIQIMNNHSAAPTVSTVVITVVVLTFGEITPKSLAKDFPEKFAMFSAPIIRLFIYILFPITAFFTLIRKLTDNIIKRPEEEKTSSEELLVFVDEIEQEGSIDENEGNLLRNVIEFTERRADDILTHRMDLEAVSVDATMEEIADSFTNSQFSRLLVYRDSIDTIVGVIHQKDFFGKNGITTRNLDDLLTPVVYVQPGEPINELLLTLQKNQTHVAVVLDEYGGTLGIVTMEDILEELVGEIWDEHDEVEEDFLKEIGENTYLVDCSVNLDDFAERLNLKIDSESGTLGGFVMEKFGVLPEVGETYTDEDLTITVKEKDIQRLTQIELVVHRRPDDEEGEEEPDSVQAQE
ncbi:MAG: HlyC/CorC family transporter [Clostridia bacterium]|nr:HlyC/CorC family transporter [Clostridia bacterium]